MSISGIEDRCHCGSNFIFKCQYYHSTSTDI